MKKYILITTIVAAIVSLSMMSPMRSGGTAAVISQGNTGAPRDNGFTCIGCHFSGNYGLTTQEIRLIDTATSLEVNAYQPGKIYDVEVRVLKGKQSAFPQAYGFQATALGPDTTSVGEWLNPSGVVQFTTIDDAVGRPRTYAEHGSASFSSTFNMQWQAPWSATDTVKFYFIGNAVNLNGGTSGDNGGMGDMKAYPAIGASHLELTQENVPGGDYYAVDSISLSNQAATGVQINFNTQRAVRLLPESLIPVSTSLEIRMTNPQE